MADPTPTRPVLRTVGLWAVFVLTAAIAAYVGHSIPAPPAPVAPAPPAVVVPPGDTPVTPPAAEAAGPPAPARSFGYTPDPAGARRILDAGQIPDFADTPAGKKVQADPAGETFLWRAVRAAAGKPDSWYPNVNQQQVGCCCGCGWKHASDVCLGVQIAILGKPAEWKPVSVEVLYGGGRTVGHMLGSGDGCYGAAMAEYARSGGLCPMEKVGAVDLTTFDPLRARQYGDSGVPADCQKVAGTHPVKTTALVKTFADVQKAVSQGYPVAICSNVGFQGRTDRATGKLVRDADGFLLRGGSWPHCMAILGVRADKPGAFILNSWGDQANTGPGYPADMPVAGFWASQADVERIVSQGDSFALSDATGFPARDLDWFVNAPAPRRDLAAAVAGEPAR